MYIVNSYLEKRVEDMYTVYTVNSYLEKRVEMSTLCTL